VLLACQGQLRLAPSGHVIGIDMAAALQIAAARSHDRAVLSELLPAAEGPGWWTSAGEFEDLITINPARRGTAPPSRE
jgi:hypothetical protein